jgi:hypothetical protein
VKRRGRPRKHPDPTVRSMKDNDLLLLEQALEPFLWGCEAIERIIYCPSRSDYMVVLKAMRAVKHARGRLEQHRKYKRDRAQKKRDHAAKKGRNHSEAN